MDSNLVKEIDAQYPKAEAVWESNYDENFKIRTFNRIIITLAKDKVIK